MTRSVVPMGRSSRNILASASTVVGVDGHVRRLVQLGIGEGLGPAVVDGVIWDEK